MQPYPIGSTFSAGCIRMMNADVIAPCERVKIGPPVIVVQ